MYGHIWLYVVIYGYIEVYVQIDLADVILGYLRCKVMGF